MHEWVAAQQTRLWWFIGTNPKNVLMHVFICECNTVADWWKIQGIQRKHHSSLLSFHFAANMSLTDLCSLCREEQWSKTTVNTLKAKEVVVQLVLHSIILCQQVLTGSHAAWHTFLSPLTARSLPANVKAVVQSSTSNGDGLNHFTFLK